MPYWIHRNGENVGPYDLPQLQEMLATGQATAGDLAIEEAEVSAQPRSTLVLAENFRKYAESINFAEKTQALITVA